MNIDLHNEGLKKHVEQSGRPDLLAFIADFRQYLRLFLSVFFILFIAFSAMLVTQEKKFTATASVMLDPRTLNAVPDQNVLSGLPADTDSVDTEVVILTSYSLASKVVDKLKLENDAEFASKKKPAGPAVSSNREDVISRVMSGLSVKRHGTTRIITISYTAKSPDKAARIANEWVSLYLGQQLETKIGATQEANSWLSERLAELKGQVEAAESAVQQYKIENNLLDVTDKSTLGQLQTSTIDNQLASSNVDLADAEARLAVAQKQLASGSTGEDVVEVLDSTVIQNLRAQRASLSQKKAELESRYGPQHPQIIKIDSQIKDLDRQLTAEIERIVSNLQAKVSIQRQRTASLRASAGQARGELVGSTRAMVKLNELQRNADAVSTLYQGYLDRYKQTSAQQGIDRTDARLVSSAPAPTNPSAPNKRLGVLVAFVGAFAIAMASVFIRRAFYSGLTHGEDVVSSLNSKHLGNIPSLASTGPRNAKIAPADQVVAQPISAFSEAFRNLRAALLYAAPERKIKVIAITSSLPGEGKTTTSICLARTIAMTGQSVVLVDCDLRRATASAFLPGDRQAGGLLEVLQGKVPLYNALEQDNGTKLQYLPLASMSESPDDVFGSTAMQDLINHLKANFDVVILDTAPVLPLVDTRILSRLADVVVIVAKWRKTPSKAVDKTIDILLDARANIGGVLLNNVDINHQAKFGYGDSEYYYKQYRSYYAA